ncbi:MAG TPA: ATP-binding cassette domain-containing protein [Bacteroidota bacterium]
MLKTVALRKEYSSVRAVDGVSFVVRPGEVFGLLGPNGAGKTTTIRMVLNILRPDAGEVTFDGRPYSPELQNQIGYLPEERGLYQKNELLSTILYFAQLKGMPVSDARAKALRWLEEFQLGSYAQKKVQELSKGNQQKVQFIIATLHDPRFVVLDEPFSGLDPVNQIVFKDLLMKLRDQGKVIVFSTHIMEQAERLCDTICIINRGKVVLDGSLREVKRSYGSNAIHLEFKGDGTFLSHHPAFQSVQVYENYAELELRDSSNLNDLFVDLAKRLEIQKFERVEPSLNSIFIRLVSAKSEALAGQSA